MTQFLSDTLKGKHTGGGDGRRCESKRSFFSLLKGGLLVMSKNQSTNLSPTAVLPPRASTARRRCNNCGLENDIKTFQCHIYLPSRNVVSLLILHDGPQREHLLNVIKQQAGWRFDSRSLHVLPGPEWNFSFFLPLNSKHEGMHVCIL